MLQPEHAHDAKYSRRAYDGALLLSLCIEDLRFIRKAIVKVSGGLDDG